MFITHPAATSPWFRQSDSVCGDKLDRKNQAIKALGLGGSNRHTRSYPIRSTLACAPRFSLSMPEVLIRNPKISITSFASIVVTGRNAYFSISRSFTYLASLAVSRLEKASL